MKNLNYSMYTSDRRSPEIVVRELGIRYMYAVPQSLYDAWHFWGCVNIPEVLPSNISVLTTKPLKAVGHGLTEKQARSIIAKGKQC